MMQFAHEITGQKRSEEANNETRYRALFANAADMIFLAELQDDGIYGRIIEANEMACQLLGYTQNELQQMTPSALSPAETHHRPLHDRHELQRKDGQIIPVETRTSLIKLSGKNMAVLFSRDITEHKHAEMERERLITELNAALANVETLKGPLPICCACKKIRDKNGGWQQMEVHLTRLTRLKFSHTYCPECFARWCAEMTRSIS